MTDGWSVGKTLKKEQIKRKKKHLKLVNWQKYTLYHPTLNRLNNLCSFVKPLDVNSYSLCRNPLSLPIFTRS